MTCLIRQRICLFRFLPVVVAAVLGLWVASEAAGQDYADEAGTVIIDDQEPQGQIETDDRFSGSLEFLHEEDPFQPNVGKIAFSGGVDFTNAYFFRGLLQEDQSFIAQPWAELTFDLHDGEGWLQDLTLTLGIWNSIHKFVGNEVFTSDDDGNLVRHDSIQEWYESDLYFTLSAGLADHWGLGVTYVGYTSPASAFSTIHELIITVTYDDSLYWEERGYKAPGFNGLQPTIVFGFELDETANGDPDEGVYFEFRIEPGFTSFIEIGGSPVSFSFPVAVGISLNDYYVDEFGEDHAFGFLDMGIVGTWPIGFVPLDYGSWQLGLAGHFLFLADRTESFNNGNEFEIIGTLSISLAY